MSNRIVLIGAKEGPWTGIKWVRDPVLRVSGLKEGKIDLEIKTESSVPLMHYINCNGDTNLNALSAVFAEAGIEWVRLIASHPTKSLICVVIPAKAA